MSYPWWAFSVKFYDGHEEQFQATGMEPTDAMTELLKGFNGENPELEAKVKRHGDVVRVAKGECLTWGVE